LSENAPVTFSETDAFLAQARMHQKNWASFMFYQEAHLCDVGSRQTLANYVK